MTREFTITNKLGLHARPAAMFVKLSSAFNAEVWVEKDDEQVNGKSIMGLMMLAAGYGAKITVTTEGPQENEAMQAIQDLVSSGFKE
ncbi:MAG: HPr family phosphocarrier protein [Verrucomicrobiales bacterium]|nr:HPr family phosphocarrier protein [Verrucomicrobiales bacterium]